MKVKAVGHRVIVIPDPVVEETKSGIILAKDKKREQAGTEKGTVHQVGSMAWKNTLYGYGIEGWEPWCKPGDRVFFAKYAGKLFTDDETDVTYAILNDEDIQCQILDENVTPETEE